MRIVDVLDDSLAGVEDVGIGDVMEEEEKFVGRGGERFVHFGDLLRILAGKTGAGGDGAIHSDAEVIGAVPLSPAVFFGGFDAGSVVAAKNVGEGLCAERAGVAFVGAPR